MSNGVDTMERQQIVSHLKQGWAEMIGIPGLRLKQVDMPAHSPLRVDLAFGGKDVKLLCEVKSDARSITIERVISHLNELKQQTGGEHVNYCLIAPFLSKSVRDKLRSESISFIDLSGNIYINDPEVLYIEREGRKNIFSDSQLPLSDSIRLVFINLT